MALALGKTAMGTVRIPAADVHAKRPQGYWGRIFLRAARRGWPRMLL